MAETTVYLKMDRKVKTAKEEICISDLGKIYCQNPNVVNKIKSVTVYVFQINDQNRCVISVLKVMELIHRHCPGVLIDSVGETESIVERIKENSLPSWRIWLKTIVVSLICFFGTMYTIMAYHNEIDIHLLFSESYELLLGGEKQGLNLLEIAYSIGLSLGIIVFYNHIGKRQITTDPSPVEVEMRTYEDSVNTALVELANREEKTIDIH